ncbi:MAG: ABC transporter permease, partial [Terriglobales bacterium]
MRTRIILANLQRRPMRSLVSVVAVALEVILILMIVGLVNGMINDRRSRISGIGADIVVRSGSGSMFAELSGNTLPLKLAQVFARVPGVAAVAPTAYSLTTGAEAVGGVNLTSFDQVSGGFQFVKGRAFQPGTREAIVDDLEAAGKHYRLGSPIALLGQTFHVVGIFEHGMGSRIFVDLGELDSLSASPGKAAVFWIKLQPGANLGAATAALHK